MIEPTPGRIVWFWRWKGQDSPTQSEPMAAIVTQVNGPRNVNLTIFEPAGTTTPMSNVQLLQDDDIAPSAHCAQWMPYQIGQAKKHEAEAATAA